MISSLAGLLVALLFLTFSVQVLLGLYATSTLRATLYDATSRAANGPTAARDAGGLNRVAADARSSLGAMGDRTEIQLVGEDTDGDGLADVVVGRATAEPPRIVPPSIGGMIGFEEIHAGARVRIERPR